jgi:tRNA pseudouridine55 synthase
MPTEFSLHGILNCYKPPRVTSRVIVDSVQRAIRPVKVGHAGTLDPLAEGVLVLAVGAASRLIPYLHHFSKTYQARFELGCWSDSADLETDVVLINDGPKPTLSELEQAARSLTGIIDQVPPLYSAVKVGGKRAYEAARKNELLELTARKVQIHRFEILKYDYPSVWVEIECGTGTYIRSLAVDLAKRLGTKGLMSHLVRTRIGPFSMDDSLRIDGNLPEDFASHLRPMTEAAAMLPQTTLSDLELVEIDHGRPIRQDSLEAELAGAEEVAAIDSAGSLRAILVPRLGGLGPKRVFQIDDSSPNVPKLLRSTL